MGRNGVIGDKGAIPWHLGTDLRRFRRITMGHPIVMGRKTFQSIGRPLPGRRSVVMTRDVAWTAPGVEVHHSLDSVLSHLADQRHIYVIGGGEIYQIALPLTSKIHRTLVDVSLAGDSFFPAIDWGAWHLAHEEAVPASITDDFASIYGIYVRPGNQDARAANPGQSAILESP